VAAYTLAILLSEETLPKKENLPSRDSQCPTWSFEKPIALCYGAVSALKTALAILVCSLSSKFDEVIEIEAKLLDSRACSPQICENGRLP
jgi:hypothetical protein